MSKDQKIPIEIRYDISFLRREVQRLRHQKEKRNKDTQEAIDLEMLRQEYESLKDELGIVGS